MFPTVTTSVVLTFPPNPPINWILPSGLVHDVWPILHKYYWGIFYTINTSSVIDIWRFCPSPETKSVTRVCSITVGISSATGGWAILSIHSSMIRKIWQSAPEWTIRMEELGPLIIGTIIIKTPSYNNGWSKWNLNLQYTKNMVYPFLGLHLYNCWYLLKLYPTFSHFLILSCIFSKLKINSLIRQLIN